MSETTQQNTESAKESESLCPDLKYSLDLLKRINTIRVNGSPLSQWTIFNTYNAWQLYQQLLLLEDIREFSKTKKYKAPKAIPISLWLKEEALKTFGLAISTLSLIPLFITRKQVALYGIDRINNKYKGDARLDYIYEFLHEHHISYFEFFHTVFNRSFINNIFFRKRPALYVRSIDVLYSFLHPFETEPQLNFREDDISQFNEHERQFVMSVVSKYVLRIPRTIFRVKILTKILKMSGIKMLLSIDSARDYNEIMLATTFAGIPSYAFQHGHFTKYHVGWLKAQGFTGLFITPDTLFVWSEYWRNEILRLGTYFTKEQLVIGGIRRTYEHATTAHAHEHTQLGILIPYEIEGYKKEIKEYIDKILECPDTTIYFKIRSDLTKAQQLGEYDIQEQTRLKVIQDVEAYIDSIHVVAGTYSTFLYDMIQYDLPVVILQTESDYGEGMIHNGLAQKVSLTDNICQTLHTIAMKPHEELQKLREKLYGTSSVLLKDTLKSVTKKHGLL